tara:strand:+ start:261 stop:596 length:336 start_codon:yes stop_codon:yes gene_type:complete
MSETQETNPVQDLIQYSIDQNYAQASKSFGDVMTIKLNDLLDQEKIRLSDQIYNGVENEPEEDGEQLDLDLDPGDDELSDESAEVEDSDEGDAEIDDETEDELEETEEEEE